ncbi:hypothetical protein Peur_000396 [Populus x canadensis]
MPQLKEETMNIAKQSDYNQIRIDLMFSILKAREDNNFAHADHLTGLLRLVKFPSPFLFLIIKHIYFSGAALRQPAFFKENMVKSRVKIKKEDARKDEDEVQQSD